jgi:hypothetical protein
MSAALKSMIVGLVSGIEPTDDLGREHRRNALSWLEPHLLRALDALGFGLRDLSPARDTENRCEPGNRRAAVAR